MVVKNGVFSGWSHRWAVSQWGKGSSAQTNHWYELQIERPMSNYRRKKI